MLNTYIKNRGTTKTIIHNNKHNYINEMNWDVDYDGDHANISIDSENNGKSKHYNIKLDNNDLANLLNVQTVNIPIDKRLKMDFDQSLYDPNTYFIELPTPEFKPREPIIQTPDISVEELIDRHISSPKSDELILPLYADNKLTNKYTLSPKKRHKRHKTHITYKVYKKHKSKSTKNKSKKYNKSKKSKKNTSILEFL